MRKATATLVTLACLLFASLRAGGEEPIRVFRTKQGHALEARFIGYQGQNVYLQDKAGRRYALPYQQLSPNCAQYVGEAVTKKRVPEGQPPPATPTPNPTPPTTGKPETPPVTHEPPKPPPKPVRPGSFFSHKFAPLGVDPAEIAAASLPSMPEPGQPVDFASHVLPIFQERCVECHRAPFDKNGRTIKPKAGLQLDSYEMALKGNLDGPSIVPGNSAESYLVELISLTEDDADVMPPKGGPLSPEQIDVVKRWIDEGAKPSAGEAGAAAGGGALPAPGQPIDFAKHLFPVVKERCLDCHGEPYVKNGRTINPKAGLRLDTYENIIKGTLDGPVVVPGNIAESTLYILVDPEEADVDIMPPKGDPLTPEQIEVFKRWILEGAQATPAATAADPNAPTQQAPVAIVAPSGKTSFLDQLATRVRPLGLPQLQAAERSGAQVKPLAKNHSLVRVEFVSTAPNVDDSTLQGFNSIRSNISHMDLSRTKVTGRGMSSLGSYANLTWLSLRSTAIEDEDLASISQLPNLRYLNLVGTKVTDKSISTLSSMKALQEVYLWDSKVTPAGAKRLRQAAPNLKVIHR